MGESMATKKLLRYGKDVLVDKLLKSILGQQEQKKDSDAIITKLEDKIKKQNKEIKELRARSIEVFTEEETMMSVLKLRATGKSPTRIYEILTDNMGIDVKLGEVKSIIDSLDNLSEDMKLFYNSQKETYFSNLSFNKEKMVQEDVLTISGMIESSKRALDTMDSSFEEEDFIFDNYRKLQDHISKLIKEKNNILKVLSGDDDEEEENQYDIEYSNVESEELDITIEDVV